MTEKDIRAFLPLHPMEFRILVILWNGAPSFTAQLVQETERRKGARRAPYPKNLMETIRDLMDHQLLQHSDGPVEGAGRKEWFKISQLGKKVLLGEAQRIKAMNAEAAEIGII